MIESFLFFSFILSSLYALQSICLKIKTKEDYLRGRTSKNETSFMKDFN